MRGVQKALDLVNKRMQDQGAHLQQQAQKIKMLRSSIATVHCTMAGQVASFSDHVQDNASSWQEQGTGQSMSLPDPSLLLQSRPYKPLSSQLASQDMRVSAMTSLNTDASIDRLLSPQDGLNGRVGMPAPNRRSLNGSFARPLI